MNIQPLGARVLIELEEEKMITGIHLPDGYSQQRIGKVLAVGNGRMNKKTGKRTPIAEIKVGDRVLLPHGLGPGSRLVDYESKKVWSMIADEILGVLENEPTDSH